jgi:hypothetical protein
VIGRLRTAWRAVRGYAAAQELRTFQPISAQQRYA